MKKILAVIAVFFMVSAYNTVNAATYSDVPADYWANKEITAVVKDGIFTLKKNAFMPEQEVSRSDFNSALLRTLGHSRTAVSVANPFSDVTSDRADYTDILLSSKLGLIYGYADGSFKPDRIMTKAEAASVISHITKDYKGNVKSLNKFTDRYDVPAWAARQYAKTIDLGVYVNYPDANQLLPVKNLNRAEAAVLLYKLRQQISLVKDKYISNEKVIGTEHLDVTKHAETDEVVVTSARNIVKKGNIIKGYFAAQFTSKDAQIGDIVTFTAKEDVYTKEGTLVIPAGTTMKSVITDIVEKKWWNRNDKVTVEFKSLTTPSNVTVPFSADVINHNGVLTENRWLKPVEYTVGGAAVGAAIGAGIAAVDGHEHPYGKASAGIGTPVGAGVGFLAGLTTKGRTFKANEGEYIWLELTNDLSVPKSK